MEIFKKLFTNPLFFALLALSAEPVYGEAQGLLKWEYRFGDSPLDNSGVRDWARAGATSEGWQDTTNPAFPRPSDQEYLWLRTVLPAISTKETVLQMQYVDQALEVFLNGQRIYQQGAIEPNQEIGIGNPRHFLIIPPDSDGKTLSIRVRSKLGNIGFGPNRFGRPLDIAQQTFQFDLARIIVTIMLTLIGLVSLCIPVFLKGGREYFVFGLFTLTGGVYIFARSFLAFSIFNEPVFWKWAQFLGLFCFPTFAGAYIVRLFGRGRWELMGRVNEVMIAYSVLIPLLTVVGLIPLTKTLFPFQVIFLLFLVVAIANLIPMSRRGNPDARLFLIGMSLTMWFAAYDIMQNLKLVPDLGDIGPLGFIPFVSFLAAILVRRVAELYKLSKQQAHELAEKNESLTRLDKLKDQFLANTSHELRTPLNGIIGISESLLSGAAGELNQKAMHDLSLIAVSGRRLSSLVNDILDFSKMKQKSLQLSLKPISVFKLSDIVTRLSQPHAKQKGLSLINNVPNDLSAVKADEHRLQQIFHNLVNNAIKFTDSGSITLSARHEDGKVIVSVSDTGVGIPRDKFDTIFQSFEQLEDSDIREHGGTGLGLTVTKQLVEAHGGQISVESEIGTGSTFSFDLTATQEAPAEISESLALAQDFSAAVSLQNTETHEDTDAIGLDHIELPVQSVDREMNKNLTILIVDDEPINLEVASNHLSLEKYRVKKAENGQKALEIIAKEGRPDLVLLDVMMPKMNGYEVCARIRSEYSESELPIVLLTAKNQVDDLVKGFKAGANDYLVKPFSNRELMARVKSHIKIKNLTTEIINKREEKARLERDLQAAQAVQETLLPADWKIPNVDVATFYQSAEQTGGDWYSFFHDEKHEKLYLIVGDVTGHGVSSALITGVVCGAIHSYFQGSSMEDKNNPVEILKEIAGIADDIVFKTGCRSGKSMTMAFACLDLNFGIVDYLSAGHVPPFVVNENKVKKIVTTGTLIGSGKPKYNMKVFQLNPGDSLLIYTDGLIENEGPDGPLPERAIKNIIEAKHESAEEFKNALLNRAFDTWRDSPPSDDCTFVYATWNPPAKSEELKEAS